MVLKFYTCSVWQKRVILQVRKWLIPTFGEVKWVKTSREGFFPQEYSLVKFLVVMVKKSQN